MDRRQALKLTSGLVMGTVIGAELFLAGCSSNTKATGMFSESDILFLDEVGETILPETADSPGAKAAKIGRFMETIVTDCYNEREQSLFKEGIQKLESFAQRRYSQDFMELSGAERHTLLVEVDKQASEITDNENPHYFTMIKQLTIWGYFTSRPGVTQALRYNPVPGEFKGCVPYVAGEKAWIQ
ncbi:MAG: gluconate 2-dehydrogenase subunit 3 family protein [Sediminicola sp.]